VKVFESIAGRTGCAKVMFADVQTKLAADLPVLVFSENILAQLRKQLGRLLPMTSGIGCDKIILQTKQRPF